MTSFQPAAFAASSERVTRASPMPWLRNTGSTINGPSSRAGAPPMAIGVMADAPTNSVPTRATKLSRRIGRRRFADAIGGAGEPAGTEDAFVEAFDRLRVVIRRRLQDEGEVGHRRWL